MTRFYWYVTATAACFLGLAFLLGPYFTPIFVGILLLLAALDQKL